MAPTQCGFVDVAEMGVPDGLTGMVESVSDCPVIEAGPGRVVLTTVSHLNTYVFDLTLSDSQGNSDTLGVTGYHKFYTEDRGWVTVDQLAMGELIRTVAGDVTVSSVTREEGVFRVYNMTVEADHDYYVGDLTALVHNNCPLTNAQMRDMAKYYGWTPVKDSPFNSHGQLVFRQDNRYFTPDVDSHIGGVWKVFDLKGNRIGTVDVNLNFIGD